MARTPGNWEYECVGISSAVPDGVDVYEVHAGGYVRVAEHLTLDDARLIANAPNMLDCLRSVLDSIEANRLTVGDCNYIRNVVADATGEK